MSGATSKMQDGTLYPGLDPKSQGGVTLDAAGNVELLTENADQLAVVFSSSDDLVVKGSRGRGAVPSAVLGSASHFVLNHGTVPMLVVHANGEKSASPRAGRTIGAMGEEVARR